MENVPGTIYLVHFDRPFHHAKHYIGWTGNGDVEVRLKSHRNGNGSKLLKAAVASGVTFRLVRVWEHQDRNVERTLKNQKNAGRLCPVCNPKRWQNHGKLR